MPGQDARKTSRKGPRAVAQPRAGAGTVRKAVSETLEARIEALSAECDRLRAELASARARVEELEAARLEALDRVAWAIDSLQSLLDE